MPAVYVTMGLNPFFYNLFLIIYIAYIIKYILNLAFDCVVHQCMKICVEPFQLKTYIPLWIEPHKNSLSVFNTLNVSVGHGSHIKVDIMQIKHNLIQIRKYCKLHYNADMTVTNGVFIFTTILPPHDVKVSMSQQRLDKWQCYTSCMTCVTEVVNRRTIAALRLDNHNKIRKIKLQAKLYQIIHSL